MYLSTLFLNKIKYGAEKAITACNREFLRRFGDIQDYVSDFLAEDASDDVFRMSRQRDELMALWDVFKDFEEELVHVKLPVIRAMNGIRAIRYNVERTFP